MEYPTIQELLESGAHFGHPTDKWNPKMKPYIFDERNGIHIVDLQKTLPLFTKACEFLTETIARGGNVLFVGTKRQAQEVVIQEAKRCNMPYIAYRWVGGTLTNFATIRRRIERLAELEVMMQGPTWAKLPLKDQTNLRRERSKLYRLYSGLRGLKRLPSAIYLIDTIREDIAVAEANLTGVPVIAILDTNCDPDIVQYPIPGNDDAIRSIQVFTTKVGDAICDGLSKRVSLSLEAEKIKKEEEKEEDIGLLGRSISLSRSLALDDVEEFADGPLTEDTENP